MKRCVLVVAVAALAVTGCGKKVSESITEKMVERAMAKDGVKGKVNISDGQVTMETKDGKTTISTGAGAVAPIFGSKIMFTDFLFLFIFRV